MNNLTKATLRFVGNTSLKNVFGGKRDFTRTLWHMSKNPEYSGSQRGSVLQIQHPTLNCSCGCGMKHMHTKGERELVEFLTEEILAERKAQKNKTVPTNLDGFAVKLNGAEVELTKQAEKENFAEILMQREHFRMLVDSTRPVRGETDLLLSAVANELFKKNFCTIKDKIVINFNVNHTVDTEAEAEIDPSADKPDMGEMRSKPQFEVDIVRGSTTLSFTCSFLEGTPQEGEYNDVFGIDEMTIYQGEWHDKVYAVAGDVLDGYLYDLLMNLLEEKGVSNEFVEKMSDLATAYEHSSYIGLLESLSKFTTGNYELKKASEKRAN